MITPEQFHRDAMAVVGFGKVPHGRAVDLLASTLRDIGFDAGVGVLERSGFLAGPPRFCAMSAAGVDVECDL